jgi:KaiC/GvpD/RAD55 family RecA-like ATPase
MTIFYKYFNKHLKIIIMCKLFIKSPQGRQISSIDQKGRRVYFVKTLKELESLIKQKDNPKTRMQWYITQNPVNERREKGILQAAAKSDVVKWEVITLDIDTHRKKGTSSTKEEKLLSEQVCDRVRRFLSLHGVEVKKFCSGNGWHLPVRVDFEVNEETNREVENFIENLKILFDNQDAEIDSSMATPCQLTKLYGTQSRKGENTEERPWWWSYMCEEENPKPLTVLELDSLKEFNNKIKKFIMNNDKIQKRLKKSEELMQLFEKHNIKVHNTRRAKPTRENDGIIFRVECPWSENHSDYTEGKKDISLDITWFDSGAYHVKCWHTHCREENYSWSDFLEKIGEKVAKSEHSKVAKSEHISLPKSTSLSEILSLPQVKTIPLGFDSLDKDLNGGLVRGGYSLLGGRPGDGKSTLCNQIVANVVNNGYRVGYYIGENLLCQVKHLKPLLKKEENLDIFTSDNLSVDNFTEEFLKNYDFFVVDNYTVLKEASQEVWVADEIFARNLKEITEKLNNNILLVVHSQKSAQIVNKDNLAGGAALVRLAHQVLVFNRFYRAEGQEVHKDTIKEIDRVLQIGTSFEQACIRSGKIPNILTIDKNKNASEHSSHLFYFDQGSFTTCPSLAS